MKETVSEERHKLYIKMDEQALLNAGKNYDIKRMYQVLDELHKRWGFEKNEEVTDGVEYVGYVPMPHASAVRWNLEKQKWFLPYCLVWKWSSKFQGENEFEVYDLLAELRKRGELPGGQAEQQKTQEEEEETSMEERHKLYIKMDEQALLNAGKNYDIKRMYQVLDELHKRWGFEKNEEVTDGVEYVGDVPMPNASAVSWNLEEQEWFLPYCLVWTWTVLEDGEEPEIYDRLASARRRGLL
ncbi:MAG: hypothetical protein RSB61_01610 [Clostridia bacterium]